MVITTGPLLSGLYPTHLHYPGARRGLGSTAGAKEGERGGLGWGGGGVMGESHQTVCVIHVISRQGAIRVSFCSNNIVKWCGP